MTTHTQKTWLTASAKHEGFPILFRRPDIRIAEFASLMPKYPVLLVVEHKLAKVTSNGFPEAIYNDSLAELDTSLTEPFEDQAFGLIALIETFAGKRTYYIYLTSAFDVGQFMNGVEARFPKESISWEREPDPQWRLFNGYANDFNFA